MRIALTTYMSLYSLEIDESGTTLTIRGLDSFGPDHPDPVNFHPSKAIAVKLALAEPPEIVDHPA